MAQEKKQQKHGESCLTFAALPASYPCRQVPLVVSTIPVYPMAPDGPRLLRLCGIMRRLCIAAREASIRRLLHRQSGDASPFIAETAIHILQTQ